MKYAPSPIEIPIFEEAGGYNHLGDTVVRATSVVVVEMEEVDTAADITKDARMSASRVIFRPLKEAIEMTHARETDKDRCIGWQFDETEEWLQLLRIKIQEVYGSEGWDRNRFSESWLVFCMT